MHLLFWSTFRAMILCPQRLWPRFLVFHTIMIPAHVPVDPVAERTTHQLQLFHDASVAILAQGILAQGLLKPTLLN